MHWGAKTGAGRRRDLFRTQLWWDHLPSPEVMARGTKAAAEPDQEPSCPYCDAPGIASTWHLMGECPEQSLVAARKAAARHAREVVVRVTPLSSPSRTRWHDAFKVDGAGRWSQPREWSGNPGAGKAGVAPNHWYGCFFEPAWLDDWGTECRVAGEEGHHLDVGRANLSKISAAAVLGCQAVWRAVTCLWRAALRPRERRGGRWTR